MKTVVETFLGDSCLTTPAAALDMTTADGTDMKTADETDMKTADGTDMTAGCRRLDMSASYI